MTKYSFLVYHQEYKPFLNDLQELGVLDIIERDVEMDEDTREKYFLIQQLRNRISFLSRRQVESNPISEPDIDGLELLDSIKKMETEKEQLEMQQNALKKEKALIEPWGEFSVAAIDKLNDAGISLKFYACSEKRFKPEWTTQHNVGVIDTRKGQTYFVLFMQGEEKIEIDADEVDMPTRPISSVNREIRMVGERIEEIDKTFDDYAEKYSDHLERTLALKEEEADLSKALLHTAKEADEKLMVLEGWVPKDREDDLVEFTSKKGIYHFSSDAEKGDKIPILLKNNRFARLYEPIGNLFSLPDYAELDLTPFFAPFFMMFFGFCLGDAGYGILFVVVATLLKFKLDKKMRPILSLLQWLGLGTIIFGIITGTFFGIGLLEVESLGNFRNVMLNNDQVFQLALGLGLLQILVGIVIRAVNQTKQFGFVYALSSIGWLILILGMLDMFLLKKTGIVATVMVFAALGLIVFFSDPKAGIFGRIGKGLWDLYGITGIFGDVLSYIRLFALGVSSAILGFVVNDIALGILGDGGIVKYIVFVIFLLIGHGLNIAIASLGSFVHPMRLTFVEFYKNAGFTGGGKKYNPLKYKH